MSPEVAWPEGGISVERLTERLKNGVVRIDFTKHHEASPMIRLAYIEDILGDEYDLDRLRELVEADRDGRCVVLPCKEGDKLRRDGTEFTADHWNLTLTAFADDKSTKSGKRVGLFGTKEAEAALKPAKEAGVTNDALDPDPSIVGRNKSWIMGRFLKEE